MSDEAEKINLADEEYVLLDGMRHRILTVADIEAAMDRLWSTPQEPHVHLVGPQYVGRAFTSSPEEAEVQTRCASCGQVLWLTKVVE